MLSNTLKALMLASLVSLGGTAFGQVAVVVGPNAAPLSKDEVANIYLGRSVDRKPVDLPEGSPLREQFYKKATDRELSQIKATWSRIIFTGKGQPPKEMADAAAVKKAVAADPRAVGYIDKAALDGSVKAVLTLD